MMPYYLYVSLLSMKSTELCTKCRELRRSNIDGIERAHIHTPFDHRGLKMTATDINSFGAELVGLIRILFHLFSVPGHFVLMPFLFRIVGQHAVPALQKGFGLFSFCSPPIGFLDCRNIIIHVGQVKCSRA